MIIMIIHIISRIIYMIIFMIRVEFSYVFAKRGEVWLGASWFAFLNIVMVVLVRFMCHTHVKELIHDPLFMIMWNVN